jgi:transposase-like protein
MGEKITEGKFGSTSFFEELEGFARGEIQRWLQRLLEEEVTEALGRAPSERRRSVDGVRGYRNGYGKPRRLSMSCGTVVVERPRVRGLVERFESRVLPLFQRRTKQVGELLPQLYLHGLAQGDFELALRGLLGDGAPLSPTSIERLRAKWALEFETWQKRSLRGLEPVYLWADGVYVKAGLEKEKAALLVVIAGLRDGRKVVLAVESGYRESKDSWLEILRDLKSRGLSIPRLLVADGSLGIWNALPEVFPTTAEQRCWNHKIVNVLDKLPKKLQAEAREELCKMPYEETREAAEKRRDDFAERFRKDHPKAVACLLADWQRMVTFYDFPKEHWKHLRTTNIVESPFAAVRLRTSAAKRFKKVASATALIWRVLLVAEKSFRKLDYPELLPLVAEGVKYVNGERAQEPHAEQEGIAA